MFRAGDDMSQGHSLSTQNKFLCQRVSVSLSRGVSDDRDLFASTPQPPIIPIAHPLSQVSQDPRAQ